MDGIGLMCDPRADDRRVCVVGLGYVGITLAVALAQVGFKVLGIDRDERVIVGLADGVPHIFEPGLAEGLRQGLDSGRLVFAAEMPRDCAATVFLVTVGTPLNAGGTADMEAIRLATEQIVAVARPGALVILRSTVKIGTARRAVLPILMRSPRQIDLAVCPERTVEGRALIELRSLPQIVGAPEAHTRQRCMDLFSALTPDVVEVTSWETAEMAKLVDNTFRDLQFAFANELAEACAAIGVPALELIHATNHRYERTRVALPGPVGGPCLEKDPLILCESVAEYGVDMPITQSARSVNSRLPQRIGEAVGDWLDVHANGHPPIVAVLGLAFKGEPATGDLRGTPAAGIVTALQDVAPFAEIRGYDPVVVASEARARLKIQVETSIADCIHNADVVIVATNHRDFAALDLKHVTRQMAGTSLFYDLWNLHVDSGRSLQGGSYYWSLGTEKYVAPAERRLEVAR